MIILCGSVGLWFIINIKLLISKSSVLALLLLSKDFSYTEVVQFFFRGFSTLTKIKIWRKYWTLLFLDFFSASIRCRCATLYLHLLLFSALWLHQQNILSWMCVHSGLGHLPRSSHILLCFASGAEWVYVRGSMVLGGGGGGLCWQACSPDPWLRSFFKAGALAVVTRSSSRRMAMCCKTQQCVGVAFVIWRQKIHTCVDKPGSCIFVHDMSALLILFGFILPCYGADMYVFIQTGLCAYACLCMCFLTVCVCVCVCQQVQLAAQYVYIFLLSLCVRHSGTVPGFTWGQGMSSLPPPPPSISHTPRPRPQQVSGRLRTARAKQTCRASGSTDPIYTHLDLDKVRKLGKNT